MEDSTTAIKVDNVENIEVIAKIITATETNYEVLNTEVNDTGLTFASSRNMSSVFPIFLSMPDSPSFSQSLYKVLYYRFQVYWLQDPSVK